MPTEYPFGYSEAEWRLILNGLVGASKTIEHLEALENKYVALENWVAEVYEKQIYEESRLESLVEAVKHLTLAVHGLANITKISLE